MPNPNNPRILIIDDNPDIHLDFKKILHVHEQDDTLTELDELFGDGMPTQDLPLRDVHIDSAFQGEEGLAKVQAAMDQGQPYSLAFIDVRMPPGWDGIETTKKIWEINPELQVVVCSAYSDHSWQEIVHELKHACRFLILKKPFESIEVRQLASALHQRWYEARHDALTGLLNRRSFMAHFEHQSLVGARDDAPLSCIMIDLDFFKRVNDDFGHAVGDQALQSVSNVLLDNIRQGDSVGRYGGEELCVFLKNTDETTAQQWAERVRDEISRCCIGQKQHKPLVITASFGVCEMDFDAMTPGQALEHADVALRLAKDLGRNQVVTHGMVDRGQLTGQHIQSLQIFDGILAGDVMKPVESIDQNATLKEAIEMLMTHGTSLTPVVNAEGEMVGQLTERDALKSFLENQHNQLAVEDVMNSSVVCYPESTSLQEIFEFLVRVSIPQVVVARAGQPIGVIARRSLLNWLLFQGFSAEKTVALNQTIVLEQPIDLGKISCDEGPPAIF